MLKNEVKIKNFPHKMRLKSKLHCVSCKKMGLKSEKSSILGWVCGIPKKNLAQGVKCRGIKCRRVLIHDSSKYVRVLRIDR